MARILAWMPGFFSLILTEEVHVMGIAATQ